MFKFSVKQRNTWPSVVYSGKKNAEEIGALPVLLTTYYLTLLYIVTLPPSNATDTIISVKLCFFVCLFFKLSLLALLSEAFCCSEM